MLVRFENVGLRYGLGTEILRDLSFEIKPKSFQFLSGPSGSGKTTLLKMMLANLKPTRGLVHLFGEDVGRMNKDQVTALRRKVGVVLQDFRLLDHLTTYENVALPLRVQGKSEDSYRAEVIELLRWVGLGDRMYVPPSILSGGEKQRTAIARALIVRPELLLADEPTGNVDPVLAKRLVRADSGTATGADRWPTPDRRVKACRPHVHHRHCPMASPAAAKHPCSPQAASQGARW
jgi:cell division transport system ATP-binding protein